MFKDINQYLFKMKLSLAITTLLGSASTQLAQLVFDTMEEVVEESTSLIGEAEGFLGSDPLAWRDTSKSPDERAKLLVAAMTFEEKASFMANHLTDQTIPNDYWNGGGMIGN